MSKRYAGAARFLQQSTGSRSLAFLFLQMCLFGNFVIVQHIVSVICLLIFTDRVTEHVFILGENFKYNVLVWHAQTNFCRSPHSLDSWKATSGFVYMSSCDRTQGCSQIPQRPCHSRGFDTNWSAVNKTWCVGRVGYKKDIKEPCPSNR